MATGGGAAGGGVGRRRANAKGSGLKSPGRSTKGGVAGRSNKGGATRGKERAAQVHALNARRQADHNGDTSVGHSAPKTTARAGIPVKTTGWNPGSRKRVPTSGGGWTTSAHR